MLYCPKCQATYEDESQRFCTNEGARLLPYASTENPRETGQASKGVFSSILSKSPTKKEGSAPGNAESQTGKNSFSAFQPPNRSRFFKSEKSGETAVEDAGKTERTVPGNQPDEPLQKDTFQPLPLAQIINPNLIPEKKRASGEVSAKKRADVARESSPPPPAAEDDILDLTENEDAPGADEREIPISRENLYKSEIFEDDSSETPDAARKSDSPPPDAEIRLDLDEIQEFYEKDDRDVNLEIDRDKPLGAYGAGKIELELNEPQDVPAADKPAEKIVLELDEIEDVSLPAAGAPSGFEIDLESRKHVDITDSMPRIELDLADLEEVSIPEKPSEAQARRAEEIVQKEENESIVAAPVLFDEIRDEPPSEEKTDVEEAETPADTEPENEEKAKTAAAAGTGSIKATEDGAWEKRSSEASDEEESRWFLYPLIGIIVLALGLFGFYYLTNQNNSTDEGQTNIETENSNQIDNANQINNANQTNASEANVPAPNSNEEPISQNESGYQIETGSTGESRRPPPPRKIRQPPNTVLYKNERKKQKGALAEKFLGFTIYYPKDWTENRADNKFLDIAKKNPEGLPIKQLLITRYDSLGTFEADRAIFKDLVEKSNSDLSRILTNYQVVYEEEKTFQNGRWRVYEVGFRGIGSNDKLNLWGRRLWMPVQMPGMKSGFIITMFATSLADDVKSVADLGKNDDLALILDTFEPDLK